MSEETNNTIDNKSANQTTDNKLKADTVNKSEDTKKPDKSSSVKSAFVNGIFKILAIVVVALVLFFAVSNFTHKQTIETTVSSVLKDTKTISELQTLIVPYNSVVKVEEPKKKETDEQKYKYVVSYHGTVTFGIDFKKIKVSEDKDNKKVIVTMPKISIVETNVAPESVVPIYLEDKKADEEFAYIERRRECDEDLRSKAENDIKVTEMAKKTAESTVRNLINPFIKELYPDYELVFG